MYVYETLVATPNRSIFPHSLEEWKGELFWKSMSGAINVNYLCLILQNRKPENIQLMFSELKDQICPLMLNRFGSSVILNLCRVCDEQQMNHLVSSLTADPHLFMLVCLNSNGSYALLRLLQCLRTPEQVSHVRSALQPLVARLLKHHSGSNIIRCILRVFPATETQPIFDVIADIFLEMATNRNGSLLLVELLRSKVRLLESQPTILPKLIAHVHQLSHHQFGCTVVRGVICLRIQDVQKDIVAQLRGHFTRMSMHKDAQCVVLALIMESEEELAPQIYNEIISSPHFSRVLQHPFGKSVIQCAWTCTKKTCHEILPLPHLHEEDVWPGK